MLYVIGTWGLVRLLYLGTHVPTSGILADDMEFGQRPPKSWHL